LTLQPRFFFSFGRANMSSNWFRWALAAVALYVISAATALAGNENYTALGREAAGTWAMHRIAVIQAAQGDIQGAKRTVSQIGIDGDPGEVEVTGVWFHCGVPFYDNPPGSLRRARSDYDRNDWTLLSNPLPARKVPAVVPQGLPADYLAADPRHGAVVGFTDETDSRGTRLTTRTYADGHMRIETVR
jgi:hypothetical protein